MEVALAFAVNSLLGHLLAAMSNLNNSDENLLALQRRLQRLQPLVTENSKLDAYETSTSANRWLQDLHRELQNAEGLVRQAQASRGKLYLSGMSGKFQKVDRNISRLLEEAPFVVGSKFESPAAGNEGIGAARDGDGSSVESAREGESRRFYHSSAECPYVEEMDAGGFTGPIDFAERGIRRALSGLKTVATDVYSIGVYSTESVLGKRSS